MPCFKRFKTGYLLLIADHHRQEKTWQSQANRAMGAWCGYPLGGGSEGSGAWDGRGATRRIFKTLKKSGKNLWYLYYLEYQAVHGL